MVDFSNFDPVQTGINDVRLRRDVGLMLDLICEAESLESIRAWSPSAADAMCDFQRRMILSPTWVPSVKQARWVAKTYNSRELRASPAWGMVGVNLLQELDSEVSTSGLPRRRREVSPRLVRTPAYRRLQELVGVAGGEVRESARGTPYLLTNLGGVLVSVAWFGKSGHYRAFWPFTSENQTKYDVPYYKAAGVSAGLLVERVTGVSP